MNSTREGEYYILKNPLIHKYLKLTPQEYFIYRSMDGAKPIKDLVVAYLFEFHTLAPARITGIVHELLGESVRINSMGPGEYFDKIALIKDIPRTATVKAATEGELLVFEKKDFDEIMKKSAFVAQSLTQTSSRRMFTDRKILTWGK